jgi:hypothetical protein
MRGVSCFEFKTVVLNDLIHSEILKVSLAHGVDSSVLEELAQFVIDNYRKKTPKPKAIKPPKVKRLTLAEVKAAVLGHFKVADAKVLKQSAEFIMATNGMDIKLTGKEGWETLHRKFIGILPGEDGEAGNGCINGINIFKYTMPWRTFGLDPKVATTEDVKAAYRNLSKVYHPDVPGTGDARIFERLTVFYESLTEKV